MNIKVRTDNKVQTPIIRVTGPNRMMSCPEKEIRSITKKRKIVLIIKVGKIFGETTTPRFTFKKKSILTNSQSNEVWQQTKL